MRRVLSLIILAAGLVMVVTAYARVGSVPKEVWDEATRHGSVPPYWEQLVQARFLQSAYMAACGVSLFSVGAVALVVASRPSAGSGRDNAPGERTGPTA